MGKAQKKTGKGRLDKYYKLAKEQGYRARSAFKLIQLNKKYNFLGHARCCIDLCAAPGGWLQVASKYMPVNSVIVGVDLVPIKPIPRVVTFASDITTPQCRNLIQNELKGWKADIVLHDGAPNVGTAWIQDAYTQSELVLMSLKLAVEFLIKGGTFVTKVFRSVDYNNLIWVFGQLFGKVEATKPPSSRNVSAEIFVVCREFLAPKHIDPKFLDPKHVFKELASSITNITGNDVQANVFHPEKRRRQRDGYADGDYILYKSTSSSSFIQGHDPVAVLGTFNRILFATEEEKQWLTMDITTQDVKENCADLKVLGKGDFKILMKWRSKLREELGLDVKTKETEEMTEAAEIEEVDEEQQVSEELERLNKEAASRKKRERRRANELRTKTIQRMQLQMTAPLDIGLEQHDAALGVGQEDVFDLEETEKHMTSKAQVQWLDDETLETVDSGEEDETKSGSDNEDHILSSSEERDVRTVALEEELDGLYDAYKDRLRERDAKFKAKEERSKNKEREKEWNGIQAERDNDEESTDSEGGWDVHQKNKFSDNGTCDEESSDEDRGERDFSTIQKRARSLEDVAPPVVKRRRLVTNPKSPSKPSSTTALLWFSQGVFADLDDKEIEGENEEEDQDMDGSGAPDETNETDQDLEDSDDFQVVPHGQDDDTYMWDVENDDGEAQQEKVRQTGLNTAETVTLAQLLVNRQKTKTELIDSGFNRYSLNSKEGLPSWFLEDEAKHYKANLPVTKEAVAALRAKQRALDARPIKKVAEAKARKKLKTAQRLEKAMKKAEGVNETSDISEREKAKQIEKLMQKGLSSGKKARKETKLVVAKGPHKGIKGRPKGVKGRYVMVDSRMKKEVRAKKRRDNMQKKRKHA